MGFWGSVKKAAKNYGRKVGIGYKRTGYSKSIRRKAAKEIMVSEGRGAGTISYKSKRNQ